MSLRAFGVVLKRLREERQFSLRDLGQLAELDHAYVYRLETGEKEAPSEEALARLVRALKLTERRERLLHFLAGREVALELVDASIIDDPTLAIEDVESAAQMSFRGKSPTTVSEWRTAIDRIRKIREEFEDDG